jgi:hypothetical protein
LSGEGAGDVAAGDTAVAARSITSNPTIVVDTVTGPLPLF